VVTSSGRDRHQASRTGVVLLLADAHSRLTLDHVDDLIRLVPFFGAGVGTGRNCHHRGLAALGLVQDFEELPAMLEHVDDIHPTLRPAPRAGDEHHRTVRATSVVGGGITLWAS